MEQDMIHPPFLSPYIPTLKDGAFSLSLDLKLPSFPSLKTWAFGMIRGKFFWKSKEIVFPHFPPKGGAVNAQFLCCFRSIAPIFLQCSLDDFRLGSSDKSLFF